MKGYIYKYTFSDGKVYIGQTRRNPEVRHREHLSQSVGKTNPGFWEAYQRLGEPAFEVIDTIEATREVDLVDYLNRAETFYIEMYKAADPKHGYNKKTAGTVPSQDVMKLNDEFRDVWDAKAKPYREYYSALLKKVISKKEPLTDEEKECIRECWMNPNNIFYHRVEDYNLDDLSANSEDDDFWLGEAFDFFMMLLDEALEDDIYMYLQENQDEILRRRSNGKIIQQIDMEGNIVREFVSNKEVMEALKIARIDNVLNVLKGRQKSAYGYKWQYKPE